MATRATQNPGTVGIIPTFYAAEAGGDRVSPGTRLLVHNGGGASINLTITTPGTLDGLAIADRVVAVPNGAFPANFRVLDVPSDIYRDPADGLVGLAWSAITTVTFCAVGTVQS